jgi:hypothetical protein
MTRTAYFEVYSASLLPSILAALTKRDPVDGLVGNLLPARIGVSAMRPVSRFTNPCLQAHANRVFKKEIGLVLPAAVYYLNAQNKKNLSSLMGSLMLSAHTPA